MGQNRRQVIATYHLGPMWCKALYTRAFGAQKYSTMWVGSMALEYITYITCV